MVEKHKEGLIGLTGCMGGVLAQRILEQGEGPGRQELARLRDAFEPGALYVESSVAIDAPQHAGLGSLLTYESERALAPSPAARLS